MTPDHSGSIKIGVNKNINLTCLAMEGRFPKNVGSRELNLRPH